MRVLIADDEERYRDYLRGELVDTMESYESGMRAAFEAVSSPSWSAPGFLDVFLGQVLQDTCGFAGTEMIRRTIVASGMDRSVKTTVNVRPSLRPTAIQRVSP